MNIDKENAERLVELQNQMVELLDEFKHICRNAMNSNEYQQFKYRTLGHVEPGLTSESEWVTRYSSIDSLNEVAQKALDCSSPEDEDDEENES